LFFHLQTSPEKNENKTKSKTDLKKCKKNDDEPPKTKTIKT
jgi:hypothetical protein